MKKNIIIFIFGIIIGIFCYKNKEHLIDGQFLRAHFHFRKYLKNKDEILKSNQTFIILAFGQSNSANYGAGNYRVKHNIYNYYKSDLYKAEEPLLGPDGSGNSVWTRLGDILVDSGICKNVVIIPFGIGGTSIESWIHGKSRKKLDEVILSLKNDRIAPTHILWLQGETDNVNGTSKNQYKDRLKQLISIFRQNGLNAPFYTSLTSYFPYNNNNLFGVNHNITEAQLAVAHELPNVRVGPNTDLLNLAYYRADGVHFTEKGLDILAFEWYKKIIHQK